MEILNEGYWLMPNTVLFNNDLTDKQKLLYCLISSLCAEKWYCRATNEYIWELLNASKITISKNISVLVEKWFIYIEVNQNYQRKLTLVKNDKGDSQKWQGGDSQKWQDNITIENITNENKENVKRKHLEFVYLTDTEYNKLIDKYWQRIVNDFIERLNNWIWEKPNSKDRKNRNAYFTILNRIKKDWIKELPKKQENESWIYDLPF